MENIKYELTARIVSIASNFSNEEPRRLKFHAASDYSKEIPAQMEIEMPMPPAIELKVGDFSKVKITVEFI